VTRDVDRWRANLQGEIDGAAIYHAMADRERDPLLASVYRKLADTERGHGALWQAKLREAGVHVTTPRPSLRARLLVLATRLGGAAFVTTTMASVESGDQHSYASQQDGGPALARDERSHARLLKEIAREGLPGPAIARLEGRHRASAGNALRAAVLGVDDGLISNFGIVMGVAGAGADGRAVLVAGFAGMLAGALSMALGEWLSVQSARELFARQLSIEREEIASAPDEEQEELALIYRSKGMPEENAALMAKQVIASDTALSTLAREELAIDPDELGGSAYVAAATSFTMFGIGALVPLVPLLFMTGTPAVIASALLSAVSLFAIGALITVITGQPALRAGLRQLGVGVAAAAITFGLGKLVGTALG
jgi:vacuolar iron transporter family protein